MAISVPFFLHLTETDIGGRKISTHEVTSNEINTNEDTLTARGRSAKSDKGGRGNEGNLQNCSGCEKFNMTENPASSHLPYQSIPGHKEATLCGHVQLSH